MELYTSLTRLKMAMNGGSLPPMTALTDRAKALLSPAFTPGMGSLEEHPEFGLRCPFRGCGRFFHHLNMHIRKHGVTAADLRMLLDISASVSLETARALAERRRDRPGSHLKRGCSPEQQKAATAAAARSPARSLQDRTAGARNLRNRCEAQLVDRVFTLVQEFGRAPASTEFAARYGSGLKNSIYRLYGSWGSFLAQCGLLSRAPIGRFGGARFKLKRRRMGVDELLNCLAAFVDVNHRLPTQRQARDPDSFPLIPRDKTILSILGATSWPVAMEQVAAALDIRGGRYGLPRAAGG